MKQSTGLFDAESCEKCRELRQAYLDAVVAFYRASGMIQAAAVESGRGVSRTLVLEYQRARRQVNRKEASIQQHMRRSHTEVPAGRSRAEVRAGRSR
jgi:hypothetical protein